MYSCTAAARHLIEHRTMAEPQRPTLLSLDEVRLRPVALGGGNALGCRGGSPFGGGDRYLMDLVKKSKTPTQNRRGR